MGRALRRHHAKRLRKQRSKHWVVVADPTERRIGKAVHTATPCSCWMCGNPRRHNAERTIQELRAQCAEEK